MLLPYHGTTNHKIRYHFRKVTLARWRKNSSFTRTNDNQPWQIIGTETDITERKQREEALQLIVEGTASATGNSFMRDCVHYLAEVLHVRYALIAEVIDSACSRARTLAFWTGKTCSENFEYDIAQTPCEHVLKGETCFYPQDLQALFPNVPDLVELSAQSYFGTPLVQSDGNIVGLLVVLDINPMEGDLGKESILKIFAARVAAELERQKTEEALRESEAREREKAETIALTLEELKRTQSQLIQAEKMSSLGQMIAGIAHEINNPVTFISGNLTHADEYFQYLFSIIDIYQKNYPNYNSAIQELIDDSELSFIREDWPKILSSMEVGTYRIQEIVRSLRNFSRLDESEIKAVDIHTGIENTLLILQHRLKGAGNQTSIEVIKDYGKLPLVTCYASQLNQVFLNLLNNAIDALENKPASRVIRISTSVGNEEFGVGTSGWEAETDEILSTDSPLNSTPSIIIRISDNGYGMSEEVQHKIFDPFFTTKPVGSGTGLGLSISYQIVVNRHGGEMRCHSLEGGGTEFAIALPIFPGKVNTAVPAIIRYSSRN